ncbi:MAG: ribonuclease H-like domain-containing protein [Candidatus Paracaedibacteraceae bacterium]|nr:ribonuclease H-like domain-containing protein [Candidatus Paracaedibacteraceae bacterium]
MKITYHIEDLPNDIKFAGSIAVDTEAMGLNVNRDRLCLVQISDPEQNVHLIHFKADSKYNATNLKRIMNDPTLLKIFHFARFDVMMIQAYLKTQVRSVYCTKIASYLTRTYTNRHSLKDLCKELLGVDLSKTEQTSDWGADILRPEQMEYASTDVIHLHQLKDKLDILLKRENRTEIARNCFEFLNTRALLDILGMVDEDIFAHSLGSKTRI